MSYLTLSTPTFFDAYVVSFLLLSYKYILKVTTVMFLTGWFVRPLLCLSFCYPQIDCHKCRSFLGECLWRPKWVTTSPHHAESRSPSDLEAHERYLKASPTWQNEGLWHTSLLVQRTARRAVKGCSRISTPPDGPNYHVLSNWSYIHQRGLFQYFERILHLSKKQVYLHPHHASSVAKVSADLCPFCMGFHMQNEVSRT